MTDGHRGPQGNRGVSITVTHVMTIGITTILIAGLLLGAGNILDGQRERTGDRELRSIGDRISTEIALAANRGLSEDANFTIRSRQPEGSVGGSYVVTLTDRSDCYERSYYDGCLVLESSNEGLDVEVPVGVPDGVTVENGTAIGGDVEIFYDDTAQNVTVRGEDS